jgi:phage shock protein A
LAFDTSFLTPVNREDGKVIGQLMHEKKALKKRVDELEKTVSNLRAEISALKAGQN